LREKAGYPSKTHVFQLLELHRLSKKDKSGRMVKERER